MNGPQQYRETRKRVYGMASMALLAVAFLALIAVLLERVFSPIYTATPQEASGVVVAKFGESTDGLAWEERPAASPEDAIELIGSRRSKTCYRVKLRRIRGLYGQGWEELEYERLASE